MMTKRIRRNRNVAAHALINYRRRLNIRSFIFGGCILILIMLLHLKNQNRILRAAVYNNNGTNYAPEPQKDWQFISKNRKNEFTNTMIYSAYGDKENKYVQILGIIKVSSRTPVYCHFSVFVNESLKVVSVSEVHLHQMSENWQKPFRGCFFKCSLPDNVKPKYVSISTNKELSQNKTVFENKLWIQYEADVRPADKVDIAVCVKPMHNSDNLNAVRFLEWFEFHRLMGVTRFTFYDLSMATELKCIVRELVKKRNVTVEVLPWKHLPFKGTAHVLIRGGAMALSVAQNDCVYRSRGRAKYMVFVDLDEMIVPRTAENYLEMMGQLNPPLLNFDNGRKKINGGFIFQHAFFHTKELARNTPIEDAMVTLANQMRTEIFHKHGQRSKYICMPELVEDAGNHIVARLKEDYENVRVPSTEALLHHYRHDWMELMSKQEKLRKNLMDNSTVKFGVKLFSKVSELYQHTNLVCKQ